MSLLQVLPLPVLRDDVILIKNTLQLQKEGMMLMDGSGNGRVVFSLQEIPMRINFTTTSNNILQRVSENRIYIATVDAEHKYKIEIPRMVTHTNKDQFLWAQSQSDLCILNNPSLLSNGVTLREQVTGEMLRIYSLKDLPIGSKYFTENDNILQRKNKNEIQVAGNILLIDQVRNENLNPNLDVSDWDVDCECKGKGKGSFLQLKVTHLYDEVKEFSPPQYDEDFPKISNCFINGEGYHGLPLNMHCTYSGGVEGKSSLRWEFCTETDPFFVPIKKANSRTYIPTINDIGTHIRVAYTPVRADGITGAITFSKPILIKISPEVRSEVESNLNLSTLMFKVLLKTNNQLNEIVLQKRSILLNSSKVKIRKRRCTFAKMKYSPFLRVCPVFPLNHSQIHGSDDCLFLLELSSENYVFMAPSAYQRDIIVLTIRAFNAGCNL